MKTKLILLIMLVSVMVILLASPILAQKPLIAYSQCTLNHPWRVANNNDMIYWAQKLGVELIWADGNNDAANQLADCEDLLAKKPAALIINPLQSKGLTPVLEMCNKAGVPLVVSDRNIEATPGEGMYITYITLNQLEEGRSAARILVEKLKEKFGEYKGNIVEFQGTIGSSANTDRKNGFAEIISQYPNIKIIASQSADFSREPAMKIMEDWLQTFPKGQIDAVYAINDEMGLGALEVIKAAGRDEIRGFIASLDGQVQALKAILDGDFCVSVQNPPYFGELSIKSALAYLNGEKVPPIQMMPNKVFHAQTPEARKEVQEYYNNLIANDLYY
jgi:ribose transport system substrate-binding protein